jgi:hypothetical protein
MDDKAKRSAENMARLNQAHKEMIGEQEQQLIVDFDAAYDEWKAKDKPLMVRFKGKIYPVPRRQPFAYSLFISRHTKRQYDHELRKEVPRLFVPDDKAEEYVRLMFGEKFLRAMQQSDVEVDFVMDRIAPEIHKQWQYEQATEGKNAQTPGS